MINPQCFIKRIKSYVRNNYRERTEKNLYILINRILQYIIKKKKNYHSNQKIRIKFHLILICIKRGEIFNQSYTIFRNISNRAYVEF